MSGYVYVYMYKKQEPDPTWTQNHFSGAEPFETVELRVAVAVFEKSHVLWQVQNQAISTEKFAQEH